MSVKSYQDLFVWQKAMDFVVTCYEITQKFPKDEVFGLSSQLKRAAVSIPSNIAEGHGRATRGEYVQFLGIARGSLKEAETQLMIANRLMFISSEQLINTLNQAEEIGKMLSNLIASLKNK